MQVDVQGEALEQVLRWTTAYRCVDVEWMQINRKKYRWWKRKKKHSLRQNVACHKRCSDLVLLVEHTSLYCLHVGWKWVFGFWLNVYALKYLHREICVCVFVQNILQRHAAALHHLSSTVKAKYRRKIRKSVILNSCRWQALRYTEAKIYILICKCRYVCMCVYFLCCLHLGLTLITIWQLLYLLLLQQLLLPLSVSCCQYFSLIGLLPHISPFHSYLSCVFGLVVCRLLTSAQVSATFCPATVPNIHHLPQPQVSWCMTVYKCVYVFVCV